MRPLLTLVLGIIWLMLASWCFAGVDQPSPVTDPRVLALIGSTSDDAFATTDLTSLLDPTGNGTQHYGPYNSNSPDSGTCGNDWATDTFDRHFTVRRNPDGTFLMVEQFKDGSFVTSAGPSPGACQTGPPSAGLVNAGVTGSMQGYFIIPLPPGEIQTSTDPSCVAGFPLAPCTTAGFVNTHFTPCYPGTCPVTTFFFHYSAGDQTLVQHEWKNASADRGGNSGDIRSSNMP